MQDYVHLHVHSHYSLLDGQATLPRLVDKAIADGMKGFALTDHGNMMGVKDYFNYINKKKKGAKGDLKQAEAELQKLAQDPNYTLSGKTKEASIAAMEAQQQKARIVLDFKPMFGCEVYCARRTKADKEGKEDRSGWHLLLIAKNKKGYHNLIKIVSRAWVDGFYGKPRTDKADLEKYSEGIIVSSACLGGEVPKKITAGDIEGAKESILWYKKVFGQDYYLELQRHRVTDPSILANREAYPLQEKVNQVLLQLGEELGVKCICTNDVHFVDEENGESHDRLICLNTNCCVTDEKRMVYSKQEWFKTRAEMNAVFADQPQALANTIEICDKVEEYSIDNAPIMPTFDIPEDFGTEAEYRQKYTEADLYREFTCDEKGQEVMTREEGEQKIAKLGGYDKLYRIKLEADYLAKIAYEGAYKRYGRPLTPDIEERIKFELHIMKTMGFPGYFLIVEDYIRVAREQLGVYVGPGRGSAAGSAVAYCLRITDIDPIKYDLLFERFLNPDRISLPDIDIDFDDDGRARVLQWVTQKYGAEKVAHIITYGTMAVKSAIKDVARVQQLPLAESNRLCKLIPNKLPEINGKSPKMTLENAIAAIPELREAEASPNPLLRDTIRYAKMLEGNVRNTGMHACGIIICRDDITDWVPVSTQEDKELGERVRCTQFEGGVIEETGLIKMDFLGLKTLSILREAVENIQSSLGITIDIDNIDIEDAATYQLYCDGLTVGTFQFESPGMQKYLRELRPTVFEDLIAMNALYRPGPMAYIPQFIKRKHGEESITYDLPCTEKYLKDTYGITVYQEQVMLLSREIADFTRGESDNLRKAMGKKLIDKLNEMESKFISGGTANGHDPQVLSKIWEDWKAFASYAFNKSHATCYSWVAYQTAYLKANFPAQYMAAVMSRSAGNIAEITKFLDECKSLDIRCLGPDINDSNLRFSVNHLSDIRFGLGAIKGLGDNAVQAIIEERKQNGAFNSIYDFVERINLKACGRKNLEVLALAGAFDQISGLQREQFFATDETGNAFLDSLVLYGTRFQEDTFSNSNSLFGDSTEVAIRKPPAPQHYEAWSDLEKLNRECELIGLYVTGHPLDAYSIILKHMCTTQVTAFTDLQPLLNQNITFGGLVSHVEERTSKRGAAYGRVRIEDFSGSGELVLFGNDWAEFKGYFAVGNSLYIRAQILPDRWRGDESPQLKINQIEWLADVQESHIQSITITAELTAIDADLVNTLTAMVLNNEGNSVLNLLVSDLSTGQRVMLTCGQSHINITKELIAYLNANEALSYKIN